MGHMIWHNVIHTEMTEKCLGRTENTSQGTEIREDPSEQMRTYWGLVPTVAKNELLWLKNPGTQKYRRPDLNVIHLN